MSHLVPNGRMPGLDVCRAGMMVLGVVLHGAAFTQYGSESGFWLQSFSLISNNFRMEAFFMVSGLLSAKMLQRKEPGQWLLERSCTLLVPFVSGVLIISPGCEWLASFVSGIPARHQYNVGFYWFLPALFACCTCTVAVVLLLETLTSSQLRACHTRATFLLTHSYARFSVFTIVSILGLLALIMREMGISFSTSHAHDVRFTSRLFHDFFYTFGQAPYYGIHFAIGFLSCRFASVSRLFIESRVLSLFMVSVGIIATYALYRGQSFLVYPLYTPAGSLLFIALLSIKSCISLPCCSLILAWSSRLKASPEAVVTVSRASYTMYILHGGLITLAISVAARTDLVVELRAALVIVTTLVVSYLVHVLLVEKMPVAAFLLNGKQTLPANRGMIGNHPLSQQAG
mgnify:CR=1 FL=1